jgi:hypothetical protein
MVQEKRFCTSCGAPIGKEDQFCGSCGRQLSTASPEPASAPSTAPAQAVPPQSPVVPGEQIIGVIPAVSRKKGMFNIENFNVVVTEKRMIFALMTNEMIKEEAKKAGKEGGLLSGIANAMTVGYTFYKRYFDMTPESALKETAGNFDIERSSLRKIKFVEGQYKRDQNRRNYYDNSKLELETAGGKFSFTIPHDFHNAAYEVLHKAGL